MTAAGRRIRLAATVVVLGLLLAGSVWGADDDFPFGPFRMFANSGKANGVVSVPQLVGVVDGRTFRISPESVHIRRAEIEGQFNRFREARLLESLARSYIADGHELDELRLVLRRRRIVDGRRVGPATGRIVARWTAP
jgi:hypothetical protein